MLVRLRNAMLLTAACAPALAWAQEGAPDGGLSPEDKAVALFLDDNAAEAKAILDDCARVSEQCRTLGKKVREWQEASRTLDMSDERAQERLLQLDREIGNGKASKAGRSVAAKLGTHLRKLSTDAFLKDRFREAAVLAGWALNAEPENAEALGLLKYSVREYVKRRGAGADDDNVMPFGDFPPYVPPYVHRVEPR